VSAELDRILGAALDRAAARGSSSLDEVAGFAIAAAAGLAVPLRVPISGSGELGDFDLDDFPGDKMVVKVVSPEIPHKADEGGVTICERDRVALAETISAMERRFADRSVDGYSIHEHIAYEAGLGGELLLGIRWSDDFGPVAVLGLGGLEVERLASRGGWEPVVISSSLGEPGRRLPADSSLVEMLTMPYRGRRPRTSRDELERLVERLLDIGERWMAPDLPRRIGEFEVNPVALTADGPVALDALARVASGQVRIAAPRPLNKLARLFEPRSIVVAGVSKRMNVGRIILRNILRQGFPSGCVQVVKPGIDELDGCRCVDDVAALGETADLAVLAVSAEQLPGMVEEIVESRLAESLILIPGGLGELEGSEVHASRVAQTLEESRSTEWGGPVANGGNCLGVRSVPGSYDTLFIPGHKLSFPEGEPAPLALLSQSGAFAAARCSKLSTLSPKYVVTFGNQIDLTLGDYLEYLEGDEEIRVFACYVEGFRPLDGRRFLEASRRIVDSGRSVVLYRAARTRAGASAAASHTASVAGSYTLTRELAAQSGVQVAETIEEFEDLVRAFTLLEGRTTTGCRLGAMSNAGFESVAMADSLGALELARLCGETLAGLGKILSDHRLETIVAARNPLDLTPILGDAGFESAVRAVLADPGVDLGVVGCVPLTGALQTVEAGEGHPEDVGAEGSVGRRLIHIWKEGTKPWVAVVDSGPLFDPLAAMLEEAGIPTFRTADRALGALNRWAAARLPRPDGQGDKR
jgi:acyl-CoA synthetase (NDP forming)